MKRYLYYSIIVFCLFSCRKDPGQDRNTNTNSGLIKTLFSGSYLATNYYNADGLIVKSYVNDSSQVLYTYNGDTVGAYYVYVDYYTHRVDTTLAEVYLLVNHLASWHDLYLQNGSEKNQYDLNGYLVFAKQYGDIGYGNNHYFYQNGNLSYELDTAFDLMSNLQSADSVVYFYDAMKLNSLSNENFGEPYLGKSSKNVVMQRVQFHTNFSTMGQPRDTFITGYTYSFDGDGRVSQKTTGSSTTGYTYY